MTSTFILSCVIGYFALLILISYLTSKGSSNTSFFLGDKQSPWYIVAFGMIGVSLSGVTFVSIPGWVGSSGFAYMQMALGYVIGYLFIALVLMPIYYKMNLTSIYGYLGNRLGYFSHKTGAFFFLLSRSIGAAFRLYLVVLILQEFVFNEIGIPIWATSAISILLIWLYTYRSGIKTVIWTDTLQTFCMLFAVVITIYTIADNLGLSFTELFEQVAASDYSKIFYLNDYKLPLFFPKYFFGGVFIAIAMTGLDQDLMQKNLSCRNIKEAQKNMHWFNGTLVLVHLLFLSLGAALYIYMNAKGLAIPERTDLLYPLIAKNHLGLLTGGMFFIGLIAAAYSSADSALTALTTSFCVDILGYEGKENTLKPRKRYAIHIGFSLILFLLILLFTVINKESVILALFKAVTYTYGPLLGLFFFGIFTKRSVKDSWVPIVCLIMPVICYIVSDNSTKWLNGYEFGFELLILNGLLTFVGLYIISRSGKKEIRKYE